MGKKQSKETIEKRRLSMLGKNAGDKNPMWNGGTSKNNYSLEFKRMRHQIRERDNYICQLCLRNETTLLQELHIHHIDYNRNNNIKSNLISLCKSCHSKTIANRGFWLDYFFHLRVDKVLHT